MKSRTVLALLRTLSRFAAPMVVLRPFARIVRAVNQCGQLVQFVDNWFSRA
jgi:hypothetical protein